MAKIDLSRCYPNLMVPSVADIPFDKLAALGYRCGIIDVDNTLLDVGSRLVSTLLYQPVHRAMAAGHLRAVAIVSNIVVPLPSLKSRVRFVADQVGTRHYHCACLRRMKPKPDPFLRALELMGAKPEETFAVDDQISKGIACARGLNIFSILVDPIGGDPWWRRGKRRKEAAIRQHWLEQRLVPVSLD